MNDVNKNAQVEIPVDIMELVFAFADAQTGTVLEHYKDRSQTDAAKIRDDCIIGKLGEFGTCMYLIRRDYDCTKPDLEVYVPGDKRFCADMVSNGNQLCVKSQSIEQAGRFGLSWVFQYGGNGVGHRDRILDDGGNKLFVGCLVDDRTVDIKAILPMNSILEANILTDPKLLKYRGIKKVLYYKDLRERFDDLFVV